jgi:hypothetical protein
MLLTDVTRFELYHDTGESDPYEDPEKIRERVGSLAAEADAAVETVDLAGRSRDERRTTLEDVRSRVGDDKPYVVDNRMFRPDTFGSRRPVLLVEYDDAGADLYPHRNYDVEERLPISVGEALDDLAGEGSAADLERVHAEDADDSGEQGDAITTPTGAAVRVAEKAMASVTSS